MFCRHGQVNKKKIDKSRVQSLNMLSGPLRVELQKAHVFGLFWTILDYFGLFWTILDCLDMFRWFWHVLAHLAFDLHFLYPFGNGVGMVSE